MVKRLIKIVLKKIDTVETFWGRMCGVLVDSDLKFCRHTYYCVIVEEEVNKANRILGLIRRSVSPVS